MVSAAMHLKDMIDQSRTCGCPKKGCSIRHCLPNQLAEVHVIFKDANSQMEGYSRRISCHESIRSLSCLYSYISLLGTLKSYNDVKNERTAR